MATKQYSTFIVDGLWFGVDVAHVQEVIRYQETTPVPLAHPTVKGLINLRGQIVTAIDLRTRLELPPLDGERRPMNVVLRTSEGAVSLLVDEISDVINVDDDTWEAPPETLDGVARELILGTHKLEGALLLVLDVAKAVELQPA